MYADFTLENHIYDTLYYKVYILLFVTLGVRKDSGKMCEFYRG